MPDKYVVLKPGRKARHEITHAPLQAGGDYWPDGPYLRRRIADGDIEETTDPRSIPPELPVPAFEEPARATTPAAEEISAAAPVDSPTKPETTKKNLKRGAAK